MAFATLEEVREQTSLNTVSALSDDELQRYIDRASSWIRRDTRRSFEGETDGDILADLVTATTLLVEYLWYWDQPETKDGFLSGVESERIGSYSYNKKASPGRPTGNAELDSIIMSLRATPPSTSFFSVFGPSRVKR